VSVDCKKELTDHKAARKEMKTSEDELSTNLLDNGLKAFENAKGRASENLK